MIDVKNAFNTTLLKIILEMLEENIGKEPLLKAKKNEKIEIGMKCFNVLVFFIGIFNYVSIKINLVGTTIVRIKLILTLLDKFLKTIHTKYFQHSIECRANLVKCFSH